MTTLKCDVILIIIFFIIGAGGGFTLGYVSAPKEITQVQNIEQHQVQYQMQGQVQVTVAGGRELKSVMVQVDKLTNVNVLIITNGVTNK